MSACNREVFNRCLRHRLAFTEERDFNKNAVVGGKSMYSKLQYIGKIYCLMIVTLISIVKY